MVGVGNSLWRDRQQIRHICVLVGAYFVAMFVTVSFTRFEGGVAMIWVASGILCVNLRHRPDYSWWLRCTGCLIAGAVVTTFFGLGAAAALPIGLVNIAEAVLCARLLNHFLPQNDELDSPRAIGGLIVVAGLLVPVVSAFPAAEIARLSVGAPYWPNWLSWVAAHALGSLTIMPLGNLLLAGNISSWTRSATRKDWLSAAGLLAALVAVTTLVFAQNRFPLLFLPFLPMILIVFRLGRLGGALGLVVLATIGIGFTMHGSGPINLIQAGIGERAQFLQFYLATALLISLPVAVELSRRKDIYVRLQESAALYQVLADRTGDILMALEIDGTIRFASPSVRKLLGVDPQDIMGRNARDIVTPDDVDDVVAIHREALLRPDETFMQEFRVLGASGEVGWFEAHTRATVNDDGAPTGAVSVIREVSSRKAKELDLSRDAVTDPLTGVLNRRGLENVFADRVAQRTTIGEIGCIALFDLDHFKQVNDQYGHATGDDVLKAFSAMLSSTVRDTDVVARVGGEEFVVLLIGADVQQASAVCERILRRLADTVIFTRNKMTMSVTASAGLAVMQPGSPLAAMMAEADKALYSAKAGGRNQLAVAA